MMSSGQIKKVTFAATAFAALVLVTRAAMAGTVTVEDCVSAAVKNSPSIAALQSLAKASEFAYSKDRSSLWPGLSLSDEQSYSRFGPDAAFADGPENKASAEFALDLQRLVAPPTRLSELEIQRSQLLLVQAQAQLRRDVIHLFHNVSVLLRKTEEQSEAVAYVDGHIRDIEKLEDSGLDVSLDLLRAKSQRKALDLAANAHDAEFVNDLAELQSLTGLTLHPEDFHAELDLTEAPIDSKDDLSQRLMITLQSRLASLDLMAARIAVKGSGRFSAPSLRLGLEHNFQAIDPNTPGDRAYGSLSFDAFDWGQKGHESQELDQALIAQEKTYHEQDRALRLYAGQLIVDIAHARKAYEISSDMVKDEQQGMEIAKAYYRQGKIKETDLLSVFADYLSARDQRDEALLNALDKQEEWQTLWQGTKP